MSIYGLYIRNGNCAGFWVQHRTWRNVCARVITIAGRSKGGLPGAAPHHDHAPIALQCYDVRSGRPTPPDAAPQAPQDAGFVIIAEPSWSRN